MAINFTEVLLGTIVIEQNGKEYEVQVRAGNCLAVLITKSEDAYYLYSFFADEQHLKNIAKEDGRVIWDNIVSCRLNMRYKECSKLLKYLVRQCEVVCYYE